MLRIVLFGNSDNRTLHNEGSTVYILVWRFHNCCLLLINYFTQIKNIKNYLCNCLDFTVKIDLQIST